MKSYEHPDVLGAQRILRPNSTDLALSSLVSDDAYSRYSLDAAGKMSWGPGNAATDVTLERYWDGSKLWLKIAPNLQTEDLIIKTLNVWNNALSINVSGQVTAGTWMGSAVGALYGGTGQTGVTTGDLLYGSTTNTWNRRAATTNGYVLTLSGGIPVWAAPAAASTFATPVVEITVTWNSTPTVNNLAIPATGTYFRLKWSDGNPHNMSVTGMAYGSDGRHIFVECGWCNGTYGLEFLTECATSDAAKKIRLHADQTTQDVQIFSSGILEFVYDSLAAGGSGRWMPVMPSSVS